ncbi:hypothetical protein Taro_019320, partial [Colocasia esculenta]|nr:hypothetical protein [Colocasia esculenta]
MPGTSRDPGLGSLELASTLMPPTATATLSVHIYCRQVQEVNVHKPGCQPVNGHPWPPTPTEQQQMRFMALSRYAPYVVSDNNMMVEYFIRGLRVELQDAIVPLMCKTVEEAAQRAATLERSIRTRQAGESGSGRFWLPQQTVGASKGKAPAGPSTSGFGKWGQKLKQALKGKGRGWGGRPQFQQGRGRPEVEESQQSTARQFIVPPGYRCYNCNQPGHLICNCPYAREYGYGRGVQQQQQPQQFQQPQA